MKKITSYVTLANRLCSFIRSRLGAAGSLVQVADCVVRAAVLLVRAAHRVAAQRTSAEVARWERGGRGHPLRYLF